MPWALLLDALSLDERALETTVSKNFLKMPPFPFTGL
jgi:hypothetical protein